MARDLENVRPFLKTALEKDPSERGFLEKLAVSIYGPGLEAAEDRDKPAAVLDDATKSFVEDLPGEVQVGHRSIFKYI
jgi:hypothetical protein